jgi:hypothetical protein
MKRNNCIWSLILCFCASACSADVTSVTNREIQLVVNLTTNTSGKIWLWIAADGTNVPGVSYRRPSGGAAFVVKAKGIRGSVAEWGVPAHVFERDIAGKSRRRVSNVSESIRFTEEEPVQITEMELTSKLNEPFSEIVVAVRLLKIEGEKVTLVHLLPWKKEAQVPRH